LHRARLRLERIVLCNASVIWQTLACAPRLLTTLAIGAAIGCGTGAGDTAVCSEPRPSCGAALVNAVDVFSRHGCYAAIDNTRCGVHAQALAECLQDAAVCVQSGATREAIAGVLAVGVCAAAFAEWDDCFGNGEADGGGDDDDDDDDD
jgi:hypothetical protein